MTLNRGITFLCNCFAFSILSSHVALHRLNPKSQLSKVDRLLHALDQAYTYEVVKYGVHHVHVVIQVVRLSDEQQGWFS